MIHSIIHTAVEQLHDLILPHQHGDEEPHAANAAAQRPGPAAGEKCNAQAATGRSPAPTGPRIPVRLKNATVQKLGADGKSRAQRVYMDYSQVQVGDRGRFIGGVASIVSQFNGATASSSKVHFSPEGRASSVRTTLYDRLAGGVRQIVESDLDGLNWQYGRVTDGAIKIKNSKPDGTLAREGSIVFADEKLSRAELTAYAADGSGAVDRTTLLDFSATQFLGGEIVGGMMATQSRRPDNHLVSESSTFFAANGLPTRLAQNVFHDGNGSIRSIVEIDYSRAHFNAIKEIDSGVLAIATKRATGELTSEGELAYHGAVPVAYRSKIYGKRGKPAGSVSIDYTGVHFNHARRPVNSTVIIHLAGADGKPSSIIEVDYGPAGVALRKRIRSFLGGEGAGVLSEVDCRFAIYDSHHKIVGGQTTTTTLSGRFRTDVVRAFNGGKNCATKETHVSNTETGVSLRYAKTYYRPDGSAIKTVKIAKGADGLPKTGSVSYFAVDGRTLVSKRKIDYSGAAYQSGSFTGGTLTQVLSDGRGRPRSRGQVTFG